MTAADMATGGCHIDFDEKRVDAIFAKLDQGHLPGAAVGIAIGGRPVYRKGFGLANLELPVVLSPSIRMRICSTTKHIAALAYLLLCEDGRAEVDDPVEKHLPELHPVTHRVTMRELMGNISGLRDAHGLCWQLSGMEARVSSGELLAFYRDIDDVNFQPRTQYCYNNGGWLILTAVIERITGRSLEEVMRERIFGPIGMHDTLLRRSDTDFLPNSATPHTINQRGAFEKFYVGTPVAGEGGIVSTVDDMLRWLIHMDAPWVGSPASWALIREPQVLLNGSSTGYGFGLSIGTYRGVKTLSHPGGWMGGNAQMLKVPEAHLDVIVLVNRHDVASTLLANEVLDACLPNLEPGEKSFTGPFVQGVFRSPTTGRVVQLFARDGQQIASIDSMDVTVAPDHRGVFRPVGLMGFMKQAMTVVGPAASPRAIRFDDFGNADECIACPPVAKDGCHATLGRYRSATTGTDATVLESDSGFELRTDGRFGSVVYKLEPLAEGLWLAKSVTSVAQWSGILSFGRDGSSLHLSSWSNWALPFRRLS